MPYGIEIKNAANTIIISQDYTNYHVVSSGTISNGGTWPAIASTDMMFIRPSAIGAFINTAQIGYGNPKTVAVTSGVVEYVMVRRSPSPSSSTFGLRVYQSNGSSIAFDSGRSAVKIVSSLTRQGTTNGYITTVYDVTITQPFAVPAGRKRYMSAQQFIDEASIWIDSFTFFTGTRYYQLRWTSDTSQRIIHVPDAVWGGYDMQSTSFFLTIDI